LSAVIRTSESVINGLVLLSASALALGAGMMLLR
jgi:hypothetical protein